MVELRLPRSLAEAEASRAADPTSPNRPRRAWRQRRTRAPCFTNAGVVCLGHTGVAASLTPSVSDTGAAAPAWPRPAFVPAYGAEHGPRMRRGERCGARPDVGSRSGACPGTGILGRVSLLGGAEVFGTRRRRPFSRSAPPTPTLYGPAVASTSLAPRSYATVPCGPRSAPRSARPPCTRRARISGVAFRMPKQGD